MHFEILIASHGCIHMMHSSLRHSSQHCGDRLGLRGNALIHMSACNQFQSKTKWSGRLSTVKAKQEEGHRKCDLKWKPIWTFGHPEGVLPFKCLFNRVGAISALSRWGVKNSVHKLYRKQTIMTRSCVWLRFNFVVPSIVCQISDETQK